TSGVASMTTRWAKSLLRQGTSSPGSHCYGIKQRADPNQGAPATEQRGIRVQELGWRSRFWLHLHERGEALLTSDHLRRQESLASALIPDVIRPLVELELSMMYRGT